MAERQGGERLVVGVAGDQHAESAGGAPEAASVEGEERAFAARDGREVRVCQVGLDWEEGGERGV